MSGSNLKSPMQARSERNRRDSKMLALSFVGLGAVLLTAWALTSRAVPVKESEALPFPVPDASRGLKPPSSGILLAKFKPSKSSVPEDDALRALQAQAARDAAGAQAGGEAAAVREEESDKADSEALDDEDLPEEEESYAAEDETGATGKPIATEAGWLTDMKVGGGSQGEFTGSGADGFSTASAPPRGGGGAAPEAARGGSTLASAPRPLNVAPGAARPVLGGVRSTRSPAGSLSAAARGVVGGGGRLAPESVTGDVYGASAIAAAGTTGGATGAGFAGGGAGAGAGAGVTAERGVPNRDAGAGETGGGGAGAPEAVAPKKRAAVLKDAHRVLRTAQAYRKKVVADILAEETPDLQALARRADEAGDSARAAQVKFAGSARSYAAFPQVAANLADARAALGEAVSRLKDAAADLDRALKELDNVPLQCREKPVSTKPGKGGLTEDPGGALRAHRGAFSALKRIAVARMMLQELAVSFKADAAADEAVVRAGSPKLADRYAKLASAAQADMHKAVGLLPASLYAKGKAGRKDLARTLAGVRKDSTRLAGKIAGHNAAIRGTHRAYPQTQDLPAAEDAALNAQEASARPNIEGAEGTLLKQAEVFLPPLVKAGEHAAEAFLELCDTHAYLTRLAKAAPKK